MTTRVVIATLGQKVRQARLDAGLKPEDLAVALSVSAATIFRIERDATDVTVQRLNLIAAATRKPVSHFLDGNLEEAVA